jgi:hypothetical protein
VWRKTRRADCRVSNQHETLMKWRNHRGVDDRIGTCPEKLENEPPPFFRGVLAGRWSCGVSFKSLYYSNALAKEKCATFAESRYTGRRLRVNVSHIGIVTRIPVCRHPEARGITRANPSHCGSRMYLSTRTGKKPIPTNFRRDWFYACPKRLGKRILLPMSLVTARIGDLQRNQWRENPCAQPGQPRGLQCEDETPTRGVVQEALRSRPADGVAGD